MYKGGRLTICDRLTQIKESIYYIPVSYTHLTLPTNSLV